MRLRDVIKLIASLGKLGHKPAEPSTSPRRTTGPPPLPAAEAAEEAARKPRPPDEPPPASEESGRPAIQVVEGVGPETQNARMLSKILDGIQSLPKEPPKPRPKPKAKTAPAAAPRRAAAAAGLAIEASQPQPPEQDPHPPTAAGPWPSVPPHAPPRRPARAVGIGIPMRRPSPPTPAGELQPGAPPAAAAAAEPRARPARAPAIPSALKPGSPGADPPQVPGVLDDGLGRGFGGKLMLAANLLMQAARNLADAGKSRREVADEIKRLEKPVAKEIEGLSVYERRRRLQRSGELLSAEEVTRRTGERMPKDPTIVGESERVQQRNRTRRRRILRQRADRTGGATTIGGMAKLALKFSAVALAAGLVAKGLMAFGRKVSQTHEALAVYHGGIAAARAVRERQEIQLAVEKAEVLGKGAAAGIREQARLDKNTAEARRALDATLLAATTELKRGVNDLLEGADRFFGTNSAFAAWARLMVGQPESAKIPFAEFLEKVAKDNWDRPLNRRPWGDKDWGAAEEPVRAEGGDQ